MPELGVDNVWTHEFIDTNTRMLYRVGGFPGRFSGHDLERNLVGVYEAIYLYWTRNSITNVSRLEEYLIAAGVSGRYNRLLWPQIGRRKYREMRVVGIREERKVDGVGGRASGPFWNNQLMNSAVICD